MKSSQFWLIYAKTNIETLHNLYIKSYKKYKVKVLKVVKTGLYNDWFKSNKENCCLFL